MAWRDGGRPTSSVLPSFFPEIENPQRWGESGVGRVGGGWGGREEEVSRNCLRTPLSPLLLRHGLQRLQGKKKREEGRRRGRRKGSPTFFGFMSANKTGEAAGRVGEHGKKKAG